MVTISYKSIIMDAIIAIEENSVLFYQQKNKDGYEMLDNTLKILIKAADGILVTQKEKSGSYIDDKKLNAILVNAMNAIESGDTILLTDILCFDLKPLLEQFAL